MENDITPGRIYALRCKNIVVDVEDGSTFECLPGTPVLVVGVARDATRPEMMPHNETPESWRPVTVFVEGRLGVTWCSDLVTE